MIDFEHASCFDPKEDRSYMVYFTKCPTCKATVKVYGFGFIFCAKCRVQVPQDTNVLNTLETRLRRRISYHTEGK